MTTFRQRGLQWPIGMAVVLASTIALNLVVMRIAADDPSFAVEPDYYAKAVAWDSIAATRAASAALGWHTEATVTSLGADGGTLVVTLRDASGAAIDDATLTASIVHVARAATTADVSFVAHGDGSYDAVVPIGRSGWWEVRLRAARGSAQFTRTLRIEARETSG